MTECLFCKFARKEIPKDFIYEDDKVIAFKDIHPLAPVHVLIIPKEHVASIIDITEKEIELMGQLILAAKKRADSLDISEVGYKLLIRVGSHGGQEVEHLHLHLIGGAPLSENIHPISETEK